MKAVQVGVIGAMQRAHPALTELWLRWTGVSGLGYASFDVTRGLSEQDTGPATRVALRATRTVERTWEKLCDLLGCEADAVERRTMPILIGARSPRHAAFWSALRAREMTEVDGPLEWWWRLLVLRHRGVQAASRHLLAALFPGRDEPLFDRALLRLVNQSLKPGHRAASVIEKTYRAPTHVHVLSRVSRRSRHEGLSFSLGEGSFKGHFTGNLIDLATFQRVE